MKHEIDKNKIQRFERKSSGHRKLTEDREYRYKGYNSRYKADEDDEINMNGVTTSNKRKHRKSSSTRNEFSKRHRRQSKNDKKHTSSSHSSTRTVASSRKSSQDLKSDEKGHLIYKNGDVIKHRYTLYKTLGEGTFGRCIQAYDKYRKEEIALKIIRDVEKYRDAAFLEIEVLKTVKRSSDHPLSCLCINMVKSFRLGGHMCIAFPLLGKSVFDFLHLNNFQPFTVQQIRHISYQLLCAIKFLHDLKLTHTDLKPENMLFVNSDYEVWDTQTNSKRYKNILNTDIRIIDFGSTVFEDEHHSKVVGTRHYRPPEAVLEIGWSYPCDIWSIGCIMFELYTGKAMFMTHDNMEHLAMMEKILGYLPHSMISVSKKSKYFYQGRVVYKEKRVDEKYIDENCIPLKETFMHNDCSHYKIYNLIEKLLLYEPNKRLKASEAIRHTLFQDLHCSFRRG